MKFDKKYIIVIGFMGAMIVVLLIYYFLMDGGSNDIILNGNFNGVVNNTNTVTINNHPFLVDDHDIYFNANDIINKYYQDVIDGNKNELINILDKEYIANNGINTSNILDKITTNYDEITYYAKSIYEKSYGNVMYYFINGDVHEYDFNTEMLYERTNVNFLIVYDKNNRAFSVLALNIDNIYNYAQNYVMVESKKITDNGYNRYSNISVSSEEVAKKYVVYFKSLLYLNTEKAYQMLESNYKASFGSLENFNKQLSNIYASININRAGFGEKDQNDKRVYSFVMTNGQIIYLYETGVMNYQIAIQ